MPRLLVISLFLLVLATLAVAEVPQTINHQGYLTSVGGSPVNAAVDMTFTLYNAETDGTNLWTENQTVQVNNGIYAVALGAISSINPAIIDGDLWLGVSVGSDSEMTPRQKLNSVPFALKAASIPKEYVAAVCELYLVTNIPRASFCPFPDISHKKVFVSSQTYSGNMGGIDGANQLCQGLADNAGLAGTYKAWLGAGSDPSSDFTKSDDSYLLANGVRVANSYADLTDGTIINSISIDEFGNSVSSGFVWTNVAQDGEYDGAPSPYHCSNWSNSAGTGICGDPSKTDFQWTEGDSNSQFDCSLLHRIYCFEQ